MQPYRTLSRLPLRTSTRIFAAHPKTRKMSLFSRPFMPSDASSTSFHPLFRLLDDFDAYNRGPTTSTNTHHQRAAFFNPRFDVREREDAYELHGELPGVQQKDIELEFTDPQTLIVRGRSEREYSAGTPPAGALEGSQTQGRITDEGDHHATVEDTVDESEAAKAGAENSAPKQGTVVAQQPKKQQQPEQAHTKYWVSERSVGSFSRSFSFPTRIDQDAVKASLKNGILSVVVPKAKKMNESRKITIDSE
jgi:HSP20 family protein